MKTFPILFGLAMLCLHSSAQQTIRGTVTDKDAKSPLVGAVVILLKSDTSIAVVTDGEGYFTITDAPLGRLGLKVSHLGFEPLVIDGLLLTVSRELVLNLEMKEAVNNLNTVEVVAATGNEAINEQSTVSSLSFNMEALERQPANFSDPSRMALNFPGVAYSGDDISNDIVVRGNAPSGVLWRLDGIEIPNPNHFITNSGTGGNITMLSANAMGTSDFFSGAFPAEYGNATAGVMDIKMRVGNSNRRESAVQLGFLGLDLATEGPFRKNHDASYLLNYRYSTLSFLKKLGVSPSGDAVPDFQDLSLKLNLPTKRAGTFSIFGLGGSFVDEEDNRLFDQRIKSVDNGKTAIAGLSHLFFLSGKTYLKTVVALTASKLNAETGDYSPTDEYKKHENQYSIDRTVRASLMLNHKFSAKHLLRIGGIASRSSFRLNMEQEGYEIIVGSDGFPFRIYTGEWATYLNSRGNAGSLQAYAQWKSNLTAKLSVNLGTHFTYFQLNQNTAAEPRLGLKWLLSNRQEITFGAGLHSRLEALPTYFIQKTNGQGNITEPHRNLPLQQSRQMVLGYKIRLNQSWTLKAEAYFQQLSRMPVSSDSSSSYALLNEEYSDLFFRNDSLVGKGNGRNYGFDLSMERRFEQQFYWLFNASIFQSEYKTMEGDWHPTLFNSNYNMVAVCGKEFTLGKNKNKTLGTNIRFILNGGLRYTPIDREASLLQEKTVYVKEVYSKHLPTYWRLDLGLNYRFYTKSILQSISLNIQNATAHFNIYSRTERYDTRVPGKIWVYDSQQTGVLPVLNYRVEF